jgi:nitrogen regulatory protein P-II 1
MRLIVATLKPALVESVRQALSAVEVTRMTICDAQGYRSRHCSGDGRPVQEAVIEIACNDDFVGRASDVIAGVMEASGETIEGRLFTLPMVDAVQLYREVRGPEAV